jgi:integrase
MGQRPRRRIAQSKGRKDRHVMLPAEILDLLRQWWKARLTKRDAGVAREQRWLFARWHGSSTGDYAPVRPAVQAGGEKPPGCARSRLRALALFERRLAERAECLVVAGRP